MKAEPEDKWWLLSTTSRTGPYVRGYTCPLDSRSRSLLKILSLSLPLLRGTALLKHLIPEQSFLLIR
jgi:hypothetical protein